MGFYVYYGIFLLVSPIISRIYHFLLSIFPFFRGFFRKLQYFALLFHELSHFFLLKILRYKVNLKNIHIAKDLSQGWVKLDNIMINAQRSSFLKEILVSLAPGLIGTWLILQAWRIIKTNSSPIVHILLGILILCIFLTFTPSFQDAKMIFITIQLKPWNFLKHILILLNVIVIYVRYSTFFIQIYFQILSDDILVEFLLITIMCGFEDMILMIVSKLWRTWKMTKKTQDFDQKSGLTQIPVSLEYLMAIHNSEPKEERSIDNS